MGSNGANDISTRDNVERSEAPIEIKIKTLDSQTYTLLVNKQMPVPELKQQIASVTGVVSEQQRLICRGRVLKDDQLLSAYHIEDGHTLHLVVGQPGPPSSSHAAPEPESNTSNGQRIQIAPGVVVETYDSTDPGHLDINRIVAAVLGAFGVNDIGSGGRTPGGTERTTNAQPEQSGLSGEPGVSVRRGFGFPPAISLGSLQSRVIPDSLTTLSQYLDHMGQEYGVNDGTQRRESNSAPSIQERLPTPEMLAEVLLSTRDFLMGQTSESLLQLGTQLNNQSNVTDPVERSGIQSSAFRIGPLLQNLGAFVLELGRATMTLRMGSSTEAVVNAGPAVFISQSGPNPLMVQPLPFQPGTPFGTLAPSTVQHGSTLLTESGTAFVPRRIDIQIRRGSMMRENVNQDESVGSQTHAPLRTRTVIAAVPAHQLGRLPGLGRSQSASGSQQPTSQSAVQQNAVEPVRDSNPTNAADELAGSLQGPSRRFRFSVSSSGSAENRHPPGREVPSEVFQVLRSLFPGGEIHVEDLASQGTTTASAAPVTEGTTISAGGTSAQEPEQTVTDDGIFLSNFLREIMPVISQLTGSTPDAASTPPPSEPSTHAQDTNAGTSRRPGDDQDSAPNSKRQKKE